MFESLEAIQGGEPAEITTGAECAAASCEQDRAGLILAFEVREEPRELAVKQVVDRIEGALGMVDRDSQDTSAAESFESNRGVSVGVEGLAGHAGERSVWAGFAEPRIASRRGRVPGEFGPLAMRMSHF